MEQKNQNQRPISLLTINYVQFLIRLNSEEGRTTDGPGSQHIRDYRFAIYNIHPKESGEEGDPA